VIRRYALRRGSGGGGLHRGGEGLVREYEFLSEAEVTVLAERRVLRPWGVGGGGPGAAGEETLVRRGLAPERMPGKFRVTVGAGDVLVVMTPGGGGWGKGGS
jgi:N-methylhydantoinase B/oxoprolinase/acetone carboxylase alpha subunit